VRHMTALGMVVDVSHANERAMRDVLDLAEAEGTVVIASHEGSAHVKERSLGDAAAERIGRSGGLIGVGVYRNPIAEAVPMDERWEGYLPDTCDDVVAHWRHFQRVAGEQALVLGSDLGTPTARPLAGPGCPEGIRNAGDLADLFDTLAAHGASRAGLDTSAERVLLLFERAEARSSPEATARARRAGTRLPVPDRLRRDGAKARLGQACGLGWGAPRARRVPPGVGLR
jgi:membrane dipeptidase